MLVCVSIAAQFSEATFVSNYRKSLPFILLLNHKILVSPANTLLLNMMETVVAKKISVSEEKWVGRSLPRKEGNRFVQGKGEYTADIRVPGMLHAVALRSPYCHAKIRSVDISAAKALPGVHAVYTSGDLIHGGLKAWNSDGPDPADKLALYPLAVEKVRYFGEPVAVVVADSPYIAEDAISLIEVDYEVMPPVMDAYEAMKDGTAFVHDFLGTNVAWHDKFTFGDIDEAFRNPYKIVKLERLHVPRFTSSPLEPLNVIADYNDKRREFNVTSSLQCSPTRRRVMSHALGVPTSAFHYHNPDIGGGFGIKHHFEWAILMCWISRELNKPVKWVSTQSEQLAASHHSEETWWDAELAVDSDGQIRGLRTQCVHDYGAYLFLRGVINQLRNPMELYNFKSFQIELFAVMTNKSPCGPNRGYAKANHIFMLERIIDEAALQLGMDPVEFRMKNFIQPEEMPYRAPNGALYDGGDYPEIMRRAAKLFDYESFRKRQKEALRNGKYIGCGVSVGMESNPPNHAREKIIRRDYEGSGDSEAARIRIDEGGNIIVGAGDIPQGQGHETANSQIVADELGVTPDDIQIGQGFDSWRDPHTPYSVTSSSRWAVMGTGALVGASKLLKEKIFKIAAYKMNCEIKNLVMRNKCVIDESTGKKMTLGEIAKSALLDSAAYPSDFDLDLEAEYVYRPSYDFYGASAFPNPDGTANLALVYTYEVTFVEVEVDIETYEMKVTRVSTVHDCGKRINPDIVDGLIHGAIAHQVGAALFEEIEYDENGQLLTSTFKDYLCPTAMDLPKYDIDHLEVLSLFSTLGVRGMAEGAGTPISATIAAVEDALAPFKLKLKRSHISPSELQRLMLKAGTA